MASTNPFTELNEKLDRIEAHLLEAKKQELNPNLENNASETFLNVTDAAKLLNIAVPTLYNKVSRKEIKFYKRSKKLYFLKSDIFSFIKEGERKSKSDILKEVDLHLNNLKK